MNESLVLVCTIIECKAIEEKGSHQNLREIVILEKWNQVCREMKSSFRNLREIEFVEKWNQVSEIVEKVTLVSRMKLDMIW